MYRLQVALYCGEAEEGPLLQYLATARNPLGRPLYDAQYALRLVRQRNRLHASVALFCELSMFEVSFPPAIRRTAAAYEAAMCLLLHMCGSRRFCIQDQCRWSVQNPWVIWTEQCMYATGMQYAKQDEHLT